MEVNMFRLKMLFVVLIALLLGFTACDSNAPDTYYLAIYEISAATRSGLNTQLSADDILAYARSQPGTTLALSRSAYSIEDVEKFLRSDIKMSESTITTHKNKTVINYNSGVGNYI